MLRRVSTIMTGAFITLTLLAGLPSSAHAQPQATEAYRAGKIAEAQLNSGKQADAKKVMAEFVGSIHALVEDDEDGSAWWGIWTTDGKRQLAYCPNLDDSDPDFRILFAGQGVGGSAKGGVVVGGVIEDDNGDLFVITWVKTRTLDVVFSQPLTPLDTTGDGGGGDTGGGGTGGGGGGNGPDFGGL